MARQSNLRYYEIMVITIKTREKRQVIDITEHVASELRTKGESGLLHLFVKHTTAALTTTDLDPGTDLDLLDALEVMTPHQQWRHPHDPAHFPDHMWSSIIGPSLAVPFAGKKLSLGTWQRIVLVELDGPRDRQIELTFLRQN